jgi:hypothetical protein
VATPARANSPSAERIFIMTASHLVWALHSPRRSRSEKFPISALF